MIDRAARMVASAAGIAPPFELDPTLCCYSPQDNVDALAHPRVVAWHRFVTEDWEPAAVPGARARIALLLPCCKPKPYPTSREHRAINAALLAAGWEPARPGEVPPELLAVLDADEDPRVLAPVPLVRDGVVLDRLVISEPLALVPYEHVYAWPGGVSPATAYDDPGLFESRGTSVSPERADSTAIELADGRWAWGPNEHAAYALAHERLVGVMVAALTRLAPHHDRVIGWASSLLTHRSFLMDRAQRVAEGEPTSCTGPDGELALTGVNDALPGRVDVRPTPAESDRARTALDARLRAEGRGGDPAALEAAWLAGDGNETPLGLPELLGHLTARLDEVAAGLGGAADGAPGAAR
ncbi:MAG: hypothetical protein RLZZ272_1332 [Actinomycetota bacterium]